MCDRKVEDVQDSRRERGGAGWNLRRHFISMQVDVDRIQGCGEGEACGECMVSLPGLVADEDGPSLCSRVNDLVRLSPRRHRSTRSMEMRIVL